MEPYKKSGFAAPKSLRSPEQPEALSPEEGETADSRCTSLTKVRFLGIDCCLNGPFVHCFPPLMFSLIPCRRQVSFIKVHPQVEWSRWVDWSIIVWVEFARSNTFPRKCDCIGCWLEPCLWMFIRASVWFCFFPCRKTICQRSFDDLSKLSNRGELTDR